eukprot:TRINITY_DN2450_c0_g1_i10.p1 TRINITY_DN2450_c0_g1~~TRINITY_DN2450_c0_g1_i10.p1  ORF type:complete len:274 (+),score=19.97 TRINITY_DN2450_c0_g1_i10:133-954(+)
MSNTSMPPSSTNSARRYDQGQADVLDMPEWHARFVNGWILKHHMEWSALTVNPSYHEVSVNQVRLAQYNCRVLDQASMASAVAEGATQTAEIVRKRLQGVEFPLVCIAAGDAQIFAEVIVEAGLNITSPRGLSNPTLQLVQLLTACTDRDALPAVSIIAIWTYTLASSQGWELRHARADALLERFQNVVKQITRRGALRAIHYTERVLERLVTIANDVEVCVTASRTFNRVLRAAKSVLEYAVLVSDSANILICTCGRRSHSPAQYLFKNQFL